MLSKVTFKSKLKRKISRTTSPLKKVKLLSTKRSRTKMMINDETSNA